MLEEVEEVLIDEDVELVLILVELDVDEVDTLVDVD